MVTFWYVALVSTAVNYYPIQGKGILGELRVEVPKQF